jgi:PadR family transcriptional regulator PadR
MLGLVVARVLGLVTVHCGDMVAVQMMGGVESPQAGADPGNDRVRPDCGCDLSSSHQFSAARGQDPLGVPASPCGTLSELGKIKVVSALRRVTEPTLDVLEVLIQAHREARDVHGWEIKKAVHRSGPTVYGVIDRLEDAGLIEGHWEQQTPLDRAPRRRYYHLTGLGAETAIALLAQRRGQQAGSWTPRPRLAGPGSAT